MRRLLELFAIAFAGASVAVAASIGVATTHTALSGAALALDLTAGIGLIAAGLLTRTRQPLGVLTTLIGVSWLAADWVGWVAGPGFARGVAALVAPLLLPLVLHLVLSGRMVVWLVYGVTVTVSVALALVRDPFFDPDCWNDCTAGAFLVAPDTTLARLLADGWLRFSLVGWALVAAAAGWLLLSASGPGRAARWSVLVPAAAVAAAELAHVILLLSDPHEDPRRGAFHEVFTARALAYIGLAAGVAWTAVRARSTRAAISRLAADLGETSRPGTLRTVLARTLGDQSLEVAYPLAGPQRYVDADGRPVHIGDRTTTTIARNGEPVAVVMHDAALSGARELEREVGAAARLAVDNERLQAGVLVQLEDLRASRARIVNAGDAARRRIERDLHDGAQQDLLAVSYELRLARADAAGQPELADALATASTKVHLALQELRDLAHGIYPAILTEAGLGPALQTLADQAALPVEIGEVPDERLPEAVERAAYVLVADTIADAAGDHVEVTVSRDGDALVVCLEPMASSPSVHLGDRIGALGGQIRVAGVQHRAEIPCA